jgi:hypothetical protein
MPWVRSQHPPTQWNLRGRDEAVLNNLHKKKISKKSPFRNNRITITICTLREKLPGMGTCDGGAEEIDVCAEQVRHNFVIFVELILLNFLLCRYPIRPENKSVFRYLFLF